MADRPLTLEEQIFVNAMGYLALCFNDFDNTKLMLDTVHDVLPGVDFEHPRIGPLAECAQAMLNANQRDTAAGRRKGYSAALGSARTHLSDIFKYRAASGWDSLQNTVVDAT